MSDEILAKYSFASWFRQGLATQLNLPDELAPPASAASDGSSGFLSLNLHLFGDDEERDKITKQISMIGPGEITGIEGRAVIRTEPAHLDTNFEYNYFPYIEFYEEDFPWRYTPWAPNGDRLRPWLALVVLAEDEFERLPFTGSLRAFSLKDGPENGPMPAPYQGWAWAHVHLNGPVYNAVRDTHEEAAAELARIIELSPNKAHSRILCPRKLKANTRYHAFLIPAFEKGRLAGLGAPKRSIDETDVQLASWGHPQDHFNGYVSFQNKWPIYYQWQFKTAGEGADFETLARKIVPRTLPPDVGQQWIDIRSPGYGLAYGGDEDPDQGLVKMAGALLPTETEEADFLDPDPDNTDHTAFVEALAELINLNELLKEEGNTAADDPIISPTLYGRWHALQAQVFPTDRQEWINELNLDPRRRIAAGLGAEAVRRRQEHYMDRAWGQFGELFEVNERLRKTSFMAKVNENLYQKHLQPLTAAQLISVTSGLHQVIKPGSSTLRSIINSKAVPNAMMTPAYNKFTRPNGTLMRRTANSSNNAAARVSSISIYPIKEFFPSTSNDEEINEPESPNVLGLKHPLDGLLDEAVLDIENGLSSTVMARLRRPGIMNDQVFGTALRKFIDYFKSEQWKKEETKTPLYLTGEFKPNLLKAIDPPSNMMRRLNIRLSADPEVIKDQDEDLVSEILAAPTFPDPTYEELLTISDEFLLPNLELIPENTAAVMKLNRPFIESYLVGLNHEMARELLWRAFPTDQRGTYFRKFWDSRDNPDLETDPDITPIHSWGKTALGAHPGRESQTQPLVFVLRADLLRRYPDLVIYMNKAKETQHDSGQTIREPNEEKALYPLFHAKIASDIICLGFDITMETALVDPGWFFILQQRPGAVQFGMDLPNSATGNVPPLNSWDDLNWAHFPAANTYLDLESDRPEEPADTEGISWGETAAHTAWITNQKPFRLAIHAKALLLEQNPES